MLQHNSDFVQKLYNLEFENARFFSYFSTFKIKIIVKKYAGSKY